MNIYPKGMYVKEPRESAPEFVKGSISVKVADLHEWLLANQELANDAGYINFDILSGDKGWYTKVNDFKPKQQNHPIPENHGVDNNVDTSDVPF